MDGWMDGGIDGGMGGEMEGRCRHCVTHWWGCYLLLTRRRAEEAREAVKQGLQRVRLIQAQAQSVPELQSTISQLETQLQHYRYEHTLPTTCLSHLHHYRYEHTLPTTCLSQLHHYTLHTTWQQEKKIQNGGMVRLAQRGKRGSLVASLEWRIAVVQSVVFSPGGRRNVLTEVWHDFL